MIKIKKIVTFASGSVLLPALVSEQDQNPAYQHAVPDRVFEIGVPLFVAVATIYALISIFKIITENITRQRLIDKGVSDDALKQMLLNGNKRMILEAKKWGLLIGFIGIGLFICRFITFGYTTFAVLALCIAVALFLFSMIADNKN
jgi:hypothetical protein